MSPNTKCRERPKPFADTVGYFIPFGRPLQAARQIPVHHIFRIIIKGQYRFPSIYRVYARTGRLFRVFAVELRLRGRDALSEHHLDGLRRADDGVLHDFPLILTKS